MLATRRRSEPPETQTKMQLPKLPQLFATLALTTAAASAAAPPGYNLVFQDNFDGTTIDSANWSYNYPWGTYHNHMANMQPSQVTVSGGTLKLKAENKRTIWDPWGVNTPGGWKNLDYTSGAIHSQGKKNFTYGYFEARIKMPVPQSTWPAFWMLQSGWPPELDIMEVHNERTRYTYNYHFVSNGSNTSFGGEYWGPDLSAGFHNFGCEWTPNEMRWYFDDRLVRAIRNPSAISQSANMYLILNLAVGGWSVDPNAADYPATMEVDWVKVYNWAGGPYNGTYRITPRLATGRAVDLPNASATNGAQIQIWDANTSAAQDWVLEKQSDGYYEIHSAVNYNKVLDINGASTAQDTQIILWDDLNANNQHFGLELFGDGWMRITPKINTGFCLHLQNAATGNGTKVRTWPFWNQWHQHWRLDAP